MKLVIALCLIGCSINSYACNCIGKIGFDRADVVFTGKVIKVEKVEEQSDFHFHFEITFEVYEIQKGDSAIKTLNIITSRSNCGISFQRNQKYHVFAIKSEKGLYASRCTETAIIKN
jgi:hypothetical protein